MKLFSAINSESIARSALNLIKALSFPVILILWWNLIEMKQEKLPISSFEVVDGDTLIVDTAYGRRRVRLWGIDAPELSQFVWWTRPSGIQKVYVGEQVKKALLEFIKGKNLWLKVYGVGYYGRDLGELFIKTDHKESSVNEWLVKNGYVFHSKFRAPIGLRDKADKWKKFSLKNKMNRRGIWRYGKLRSPWAHRRKSKR